MTHAELMQIKVIRVFSDLDGNHRSIQGVESVTSQLHALVENYRAAKESIEQQADFIGIK